MSKGRPKPTTMHDGTYWEGPVFDPDALAREPEGTVCIDDVGVLRQRRHSSPHMSGGWTAQGLGPLTHRQLVEYGTRPVYLLRVHHELFPIAHNSETGADHG